MSLFGIGALPVFNAVAGFLGQTSQNKANSAANQQMIDWERERAKNAHQWEVEDLRKAGLNPILSAGGSGASTSGVSIIPAGSSPISKGVTDALAGMTLQEQLKGIKEDNKLKQQQSDNMFDLMHYNQRVEDENGVPHFVRRNLLIEDMKLRMASTALQNSLMAERIKEAEHYNFMRSFERGFYASDFGKYIWDIEKATDLASNIAGAVYGFGSGLRSAPKNYHYQWSPHIEKGTKRYVEIHNGKEF